jgi:predicted dehydrogenase
VRLRVGIVGCGGIAQMMHLPTLFERPDLFEVTALADVSRPTLEAVGRRYKVAALFPDHRELLTRPDVDAVMLLASGSHREAVAAGLAAGKHVFVEKPLAFSLEETEAIAALAKKAKGRLMVGYHKRFDPHYLKARDEVRQMKDLRYVEATVLHPDDAAYRTHHVVLPLPAGPWKPIPEPEMNRRLLEIAKDEALEGSLDQTVGRDAPQSNRIATLLLFLSLIHDVNALRGILGEPERVISAEAWQGGFAQHSLTQFARDVRVSLSWISLPGVKHYEERLRFVSPEKRVTLRFPSPYLRHFPTPLEIEKMDGDELVVEQRTVSYEEAFRTELHYFHHCVEEGKQPQPSIDDALGDARWIREIARAYGKGNP